MKRFLFFYVSIVLLVSILFVNVQVDADESKDVVKLVEKQPGEKGVANSAGTGNSQLTQHNVKMRCEKCGKEYGDTVKFCSMDGSKLVEMKMTPEVNTVVKDGSEGKTVPGSTESIEGDNVKGDSITETMKVTGNNGSAAPGKTDAKDGYENFSKAMEYIRQGDKFRQERNDFTSALTQYKLAEELAPDHFKLHYRLGGAYWKLGDKENALKHLDKCKLLYPKGRAGITKIDEYIVKLERGLSKEEMARRQEAKSGRIDKIMTEALKINKEKWSEMVLVPEGVFIMGSPEDEFNDEEKPVHEVFLSSYYIGKYEVTNALYWEFLDYMRKTNDHSKCYFGEGPNKDHVPDKWYTDSYYEHPGWPVTRIDWYDAYAFAAWAGKRLLTEAEWEKAARGTDARRFPWGNIWDQAKCNAGLEGSLAVGSNPSGAGVYDVHDLCGSVQEWCNDWHHAMYYGRSPSRDPQGPIESTNIRVIRGSSLFANNVYQMRATIRWYDEPHRRNRSVGIRCGQDFEKKEE